MALIFSFTTLFTVAQLLTDVTISQIDLLTNGSQKTWVLSSMTPDHRCSSAADDQWTFHADGTFEFNHGSVIEDKANDCSDFVNFTGTWELLKNETKLRIKSAHEKGNNANTLGATIIDASIVQLDADHLKLSQKDPESGSAVIMEFTRK